MYIGQSGRDINIRYKEHIRYIRTNNPISAYATHILNNNHEYGTANNTVQILKKCDKGIRMNCWESMFIQTYHHEGTLITEQQVNEHNPLFELVNYNLPQRHKTADHRTTRSRNHSNLTKITGKNFVNSSTFIQSILRNN